MGTQPAPEPGTRQALHEILCDILGSRNAYFQPPESVKLKYPCIVYELSQYDIQYADDKNYIMKKEYLLTAISTDPDSDLAEKILNSFSGASSGRRYVADNLYHDPVTINY